MQDTLPGILGAVARVHDDLRPSEQRVADQVLADPHAVLGMSVAALAEEAGVSDPTVVRFVRGVGCKGYRDFRVQLARTLAVQTLPFANIEVRADDGIRDVAHKVCDRAIDSLRGLRDQVDLPAVDTAAEVILAARKLEIFGVGGSGIVALDAQHKFFRLDIPTIAHRDPHMMMMSAAIFRPQDVLLVTSQSGRTKDALDCARVAAEREATVIAICPTGSPLAEAAHIHLPVDLDEDTEVYTPILTRLAQLVMVDVLSTVVALRRGEEGGDDLLKVKQSLRTKRLPRREDG